MNHKTLKGQVHHCLSQFKDTRDDDITLTIRLWREFYPALVTNGIVALTSLYELPREDGIKRYRAHFQNDKDLFLPTKIEIAKKRGINEDVWWRELGYHTGNPNQSTII